MVHAVASAHSPLPLPRLLIATGSEHWQGEAVAMSFKATQFNFIAVVLWKKLGFDVVGTLPRAFNHPTLGRVDAFVMYKWLAD